MNNIELRWESVSKSSKKTYSYFRFPFLNMIPIQLVAIILEGLVNGFWRDSLELFILQSFIKLALIYLLSVVIGRLEWSFLYRLINRQFDDIRIIRRYYQLIYWLLIFGVGAFMATCTPLFHPISFTVTALLIWILAGGFWGSIMWSRKESIYKTFL